MSHRCGRGTAAGAYHDTYILEVGRGVPVVPGPGVVVVVVGPASSSQGARVRMCGEWRCERVSVSERHMHVGVQPPAPARYCAGARNILNIGAAETAQNDLYSDY
jgi:hypothetical protein